MKTKLLLTGLLLGLTNSSFADPANADMPYLYPDKCGQKKSINFPADVERSSYFFNRDCTVAYVVPPPKGEVEVSRPAILENVKLCGYVNNDSIMRDKIQTQRKKITEKILDLQMSEQMDAEMIITQLRQKLTTLNELETNFKNPYSQLPGMTVQLTFKGSNTSDFLNKVRSANLSGANETVSIREAPVEKSYLSFNAMIPGTLTYVGNPVLESNIMGVLTKADEANNTRSAIRFNGAASGYVTLNLSASCGFLKGDYMNPQSLILDKKLASIYLIATNTLVVPAISSFGYDASLNVLDATNSLFKKFGLSTSFKAADLKEVSVWGSLEQAIEVKSWTYVDEAGAQQTQYNDMIKPENLAKVKEFLVKSFVDKMAQVNLLEVHSELKTPQSGTETREGVKEVCHESSSWWGLSKSRSCGLETYKFAVEVNGTSEQSERMKHDLGLSFRDSMEFLHPTSRIFTTTFDVKGE